jgi:2'-5' RNA ligase
MKPIRTFIAINLPAKVRERMGLVQFTLKKNVAGEIGWVRCENIHITLKFLDTIPADRIDPIHQALIKACATVPSFSIRLAGFGVFPDPQRPRVIWAGVTQGQEQLVRVAGQVEGALTGLGFKPEEHVFSPHLTLGRVKYLPNSLALSAQLKILTSPDMDVTIEQIDLMESILRPEGAEYRVLKTVKLLKRS